MPQLRAAQIGLADAPFRKIGLLVRVGVVGR